MSEKLTTFIPAGGLGSRLHPHTLEMPKPLLPMGSSDRRIIDGPLDISVEPSERIWVTTDYLGDQIEAYLDRRPEVTTLRDSKTIGSGGSLIEHYNQLSELESDGDLLILPSDHIYDGDFSIDEYAEAHRRSGADMTLMTVPNKSYGEYLRVRDDSTFGIEKVPSERSVSTTGTYMFRNTFILDILQKLRRQGNSQLNIYKDIVCPAVGSEAVGHFFVDSSKGFWEDTGTPERFLGSNMRLSGGKSVIDCRAEVSDEVRLDRCVVLGNTVLQAGVFDNSIISSSRDCMHVTQVNKEGDY